MSDSQTFIMMFSNPDAYNKYKKDVVDNGGTIKHDYNGLNGFSAEIPLSFVELIKSSGSLAANGISSFEPDSIVKIQPISQTA